MSGSIRAAQVVLPCPDLEASLRFFTDKLGFTVELVLPADAPMTAVVSGFGLTLRLEAQDGGNNPSPLKTFACCAIWQRCRRACRAS